MATQVIGMPAHRAPGPRGAACVLPNLKKLQRSPQRFFLDIHHEYGDIARIRLGPYTTHLVVHPDLVRYVLAENQQNYVRGRMYEAFKLFFGEGLITNDGDAWLDHRRIVQPRFTKRSVESFSESMVADTDDMLEHWKAGAARERPLDIIPEMMHLSLRILGKVMFGVDLSGVSEEVGPAVEVCIRAMFFTGSLDEMIPLAIPTPYNRRLAQAQRVLRGTVSRVIEDHRRGGYDGADVVSMLLDARDAKTGLGLSDKEVLDELMTIFLAGHETTGTALAWIQYRLAHHPDVRRRLEAELSATLAGRPPALADLPQMPYLRMVVEETLRLHPPIWLYPRDTVEADVIGGYQVPAHTSVFLCPYLTHRHPEFWENPDAFDPERFTPEAVEKRPRLAYLPFGGGPRQCVGLHMAMLQLQLVTARIVQRFHLHSVPDHPMQTGPNVSLRPVAGLAMTLHPRREERPGVAPPSSLLRDDADASQDGEPSAGVGRPVPACPFGKAAV